VAELLSRIGNPVQSTLIGDPLDSRYARHQRSSYRWVGLLHGDSHTASFIMDHLVDICPGFLALIKILSSEFHLVPPSF
jgi:hypothetical protein